LSGLRPVAFPGSAEESLVARAEIVIDTDVVLVSIRVVAVSVRAVLPLTSAEPAIPGYIQPVARAGCRHEDQTRPARGEIVRRRHAAKQSLDPSGAIECGTIGIPGSERSVDVAAKNIEGLRRCGHSVEYRVAAAIHRRVIAQDIAVLHIREITEDALPGLIGQYRSRE